MSKEKHEILTTKEAAEYLRISLQALYKLTSQRRIKFSKPNGLRIYFRKEWLDEYLDEGVVKTYEEIQKEASDYIVNG